MVTFTPFRCSSSLPVSCIHDQSKLCFPAVMPFHLFPQQLAVHQSEGGCVCVASRTECIAAATNLILTSSQSTTAAG